jgi:hypothetical protein
MINKIKSKKSVNDFYKLLEYENSTGLYTNR